MQTNLEFRTSAFPAYPDEEERVNPGRHGQRLAEYLSAELPTYSFEVVRICPVDWGWRVELKNEAFPLWIGCGNYDEYEDGFMCFIEPSNPYVRRWLKRVPTAETVQRLATALEASLKKNAKVYGLRWWTESECMRG